MKYCQLILAVLALVLASCQSGLDSGMGGMGGGDMAPPVQNPGQIGSGMDTPEGGGPGGGDTEPGEMAGPTMAPNGQAMLARPGATLAPNETQYPVAQGPSGLPCPHMLGQLAQFSCSLNFNIPAPSPSPSGSPSPTPSPTPTPKPGATDAPSPTPTPTPPGNVTMQVEPLPKDLPAMTNPDPRALHEIPLFALRLQTDTNVTLHDGAVAQFSMPRTSFGDGSFALQLFNEGYVRGKRVDQFIANYAKATTQNGTDVRFEFTLPDVTVKRGQVWLLALYGLQYPPGTTPSPSPAASASTTSSPAASPSPSPKPS